ncbi:hypothetical protein [Chryseolinea sp. H1M3-3]|uniref:LVIVD repeat-containing protein n=1 Tax=Chryseolinea sp. H1M3-3 TaxID=3034144 RepID=UPI0023ECA6B1|nr:hypothetical protein [Chryseolinea sp. H1M3-3]
MDTLENRLQKRMHVSLYALLFLTILLAISVLLESCTDKCEIKSQYVYLEPVYTTVDELRASINLSAPEPIKAVGKIYLKDNFLFVNEPGKGIHIIDNHDPAHPKPKSFLKIPGTYDMAVKGNVLYADSYVDLVAFNISDINTIKETGRLEGVFKNYRSFGMPTDVNCCVVTDWTQKQVVELYESDCDVNMQPWGGVYYEDGIAVRMDMVASFSSKAAVTPGSGSGPGVGGSLARFTISGDYLYMLDGSDLQVADITNNNNPVAKGRSVLAWDIETIFPYKNNLFIGSASGMHIMDISSPETPVKLSTYAHVRSCDPVVVDDNYAYVTLRSGNMCQGNNNQLEVIDIKDLSSPTLLKAYPMTNPHGLGIDNTTLFVCDGDDGLKAFNASDINAIDKNLLAHYKYINATDVIPHNNTLIMIGEDGLFQYDYTSPTSIKLLSTIAIQHEN